MTIAIRTGEPVFTKLAGETERSEHNKPSVVTVPKNASNSASILSSSKAVGTTAVGDGVLSASKAAAKGATVMAEVNSGIAKVQSAKAQVEQAKNDPVSFALSVAQSATGFSIPSSPEGIANLLSKFSKPDETKGTDTSVNIAKEKSAAEDAVAGAGDIASLAGDTASFISKATAIASNPTSVLPSDISGAVTQISSVGGLPIDNVISQATSKVTSPVQSSLTKVKNVSDTTTGILT